MAENQRYHKGQPIHPGEGVFDRMPENPILTVSRVPFSASAVLNPGVAECDGDTLLLVRVEDLAGYSSVYVARSANGVDDWKVQSLPLLGYGEEEWRYEQWGCEDARITYFPEEKRWYVTYVAYSSAGPAVALAHTKDFESIERIGLLGSTNDKDGALFPEKFNGRYAILHRPDAGGRQQIWSAYSPDLIHWGEPHCVLTEGGGSAWDGLKVGAGPPPIKTDRGWLMLYHGVKAYGGNLAYRVGAALLDRDQPHKVIAQAPGCIFQPEAPYELSGLVPNTVFPTGVLQRGDEIWMYYGAADTYICLAIAKLDDVLNLLEPVPASQG